MTLMSFDEDARNGLRESDIGFFHLASFQRFHFLSTCLSISPSQPLSLPSLCFELDNVNDERGRVIGEY